ncbi:Wzz/FepE/Etk N-terminal domain-containing protein [Luteimicrobium sp. DT211]|uniref:Wzz/FepE/Etk N-terminal domain-containing protein n=1 Tax=Luteimicrobium sp. DT211 TaxID=3393412 RepID=UPI003CF0056D
MTVREFLRTVWDGKWYVLAAVVIVMLAALFYLNRQVTTYQATATVQLNSVQSSGSDQSAAVTANADPTYVTSAPVAQAVAQEVGGGARPQDLASRISASYDSTALVMTIEAKDAGPVQAATLANAFAKAYVDYLPTVVGQQADKVSKQMDAASKQITDAQATLRKTKNDPKAKALQASGTDTLNSLTRTWSAYGSLSPPGQIAKPATSGVPLGLGRSSVFALSLLAGLAAGVGLAFARRGVDFRLRAVTQAAEIADAPVLAEIDGVKRALKDATHHGHLPVASRVATPYTESIRELRTAVQVSGAHRDQIAVVVTAADPSAPRSFIAANLAASWALSGRRTIAMSGDMRRPELDEILPAPDDWKGDPRALRPTRVPNLSLFPVPEQPLDPADFLATAQARELVASLRGQADVLVIDAPPVLAAADATILGSYTDGVVLVASVGKTDQLVLAEAVKRLRVNHVHLSGLAVAGVKGSRRMAYAATYGEASATTAATTTAPPATSTTVVPTTAGRADRRSVVPQRDVAVQPGPAGQQNGRPQGPAAHVPVHAPAAQPSTAAHPVATTTGAVRTAAPSLRQGRPRIQPAWSPVQNRPRTGAVAVVDDEAHPDRPAAPEAR